jgi:hypothetical protein
VTGLAFAGGALACAATAIAAVAVDRLSVQAAHARAVSDDEQGDAVTADDGATRRLEAIRSLLIAVSAVAASAAVYARIGWTAPLPAACCLCAAGPPLSAAVAAAGASMAGRGCRLLLGLSAGRWRYQCRQFPDDDGGGADLSQ